MDNLLFTWDEREYILCRQQSNLVLYLSRVGQGRGKNAKKLECYEIVFGKEEANLSRSNIQRQRIPADLVDGLRMEEGVQKYVVYHTTGRLLLSPSEFAATTMTAESAYNRPDCPLFTKLNDLLPTLNTSVDIMGVTHLQKVEKAAECILPNIVTCLSVIFLQNENIHSDDRMCENYGACKDGVIVLQEVDNLELHHPFNGVSTGSCILLNDLLLFYDLPSDYYNNMSPVNSICVRNCILKLEASDEKSCISPTFSKNGKGRLAAEKSKSTKLLSISSAASNIVLGFPELHAMKEFVEFIDEASDGCNNCTIFRDEVINPALTAEDRKEYIKNMTANDFCDPLDFSYPEERGGGNNFNPEEGGGKTERSTPESGRRMSLGTMEKLGDLEQKREDKNKNTLIDIDSETSGKGYSNRNSFIN